MPKLKKSRPKVLAAPKSLHRPEYKAVLATLLEMREDADLLQSEPGKKLGRSQSYVSMAERGAIRLVPSFVTGASRAVPRWRPMSTSLNAV
ncbi:hypothetical protein ABQJ54_10865 [Rhodanobacter sp. Si-c]|uniref:XRE family transcriptional regulator n=1 Tax=Rhodanobacter lycopersici TaxID=3162487 RepID=A0ABV3QG30_9GAMM